MENIMYWLYKWGAELGYFLVTLPIGWDIFYRGGRELDLVSIGGVGVLIQLVGIILIALAKYSTKVIDRKTKPRR